MNVIISKRMIEEMKSWGLLIQQYFLSICQYISFYIKRLGSLTSSSTSGGTSATGTHVVVSNKHINLCHANSNESSDRKQILSSTIKFKPSSLIPGPKCMPVFGTLFEFNKFGSSRVHELAAERHAKYGDIFREKLFSQELVFVANTDFLKQWMAQEGKLPVSLKQDPSLVFGECCPYLKRGLFFRNGEEWYKLRKLGHSIVHKNTSDFESYGLFDACVEFIGGFMKDMKQSVQKNEDGLMYDCEIRSYDIAVGALISVVYGGNADKLQQYTGTDYVTLSRNAKELNEHHQHLLETPARIAKWLKTPAWTGYQSKLHHNLTTCIKFGRLSREEILKSPETASMRSHGLLYKTINLNANLEDIDDLLTDFAVDTKDPFAGTVMFVTQVLGMHPEIQERIYEEVSQIFPSNQPITYAKTKNLEYTEAFFKEVLRLYPVAAFTARVCTEDTVIGDYLIKPGTMIMYSTYVAHRDPRYFSEPLKVIPERWINNSKNGDKTCDANAFAPFGLKARTCLGQHIATSIFMLYIANLVRNFKLTSTELGEVAMRTVLYPVNQKPVKFQLR